MIKRVYYNEKSKITIIKFDDGKTIKLTCNPLDNFEIETAIAYAIAFHEFGSKDKFFDFCKNSKKIKKLK